MARSTILLFVISLAAYGKVITHSDEIHPNYRVQLPQLGNCFHDPIWEEALQQSFPQFDAVLHETEDGRMMVGFLDRFSPGRLIIWTHLRRPQQSDSFDGGGYDDDSTTIAQQMTQPPSPPGGSGQPPNNLGRPGNPPVNPDSVHTPEPATFTLVGVALVAAASIRFKRR
jgi:hypothetical protein